MASDASQPTTTNPHEAGDPSLSPAVRKRLQTMYEFGQQKSTAGDYDYAHDMFAGCVNKDPSNLVYVETMLANLQAKYENNKKGGKAKGNRSDFKKAISSQEWVKALELGVDLLKYNPWDVATLLPMAAACEALHFNEVELRYLKNALDANPKSIDVNRHCASSLTRMGQYDQAIACWHRVESVSSNKTEAQQMISKLTLEKNRAAAGFTDEEAAKSASKTEAGENPKAEPSQASNASPAAEPKAAATPPKAEDPNSGVPNTDHSSPIAKLQEAIAAEPAELSHYLRLASMQESEGHLKEAEGTLLRALDVSGNDLKVRERLETIQIRQAMLRLAIAEKQAAAEKTEEAAALIHQLRKELNRVELNIYRNRSERYPDNLSLQYELGVRLSREKNYTEAFKAYLAAEGSPKRISAAQIGKGECLQQLHKFDEALEAYLDAVKTSAQAGSQRVRSLSLYRAAFLAAGMKKTDLARELLEKLIKIDPDYRDAQARLDKLG